MRLPIFLLATCLLAASGCGLIWPAAEVITYPMDKKGQFEEIQKRYTSNIRFGLLDDAIPFVEPEHQARFRAAMHRYREIRFTDAIVERIEIDPLRTQAKAVVLYKGFWLASPYETEMRVVQKWRREVPTQRWYVTPDFEAVFGSPRRDSSG